MTVEKIIVLRLRECYGGCECRGQELVSTVNVCAQRQTREGLSELASAALFSLGFSPMYHSVCVTGGRHQ